MSILAALLALFTPHESYVVITLNGRQTYAPLAWAKRHGYI